MGATKHIICNWYLMVWLCVTMVNLVGSLCESMSCVDTAWRTTSTIQMNGLNYASVTPKRCFLQLREKQLKLQEVEGRTLAGWKSPWIFSGLPLLLVTTWCANWYMQYNTIKPGDIFVCVCVHACHFRRVFFLALGFIGDASEGQNKIYRGSSLKLRWYINRVNNCLENKGYLLDCWKSYVTLIV